MQKWLIILSLTLAIHVEFGKTTWLIQTKYHNYWNSWSPGAFTVIWAGFSSDVLIKRKSWSWKLFCLRFLINLVLLGLLLVGPSYPTLIKQCRLLSWRCFLLWLMQAWDACVVLLTSFLHLSLFCCWGRNFSLDSIFFS